MAHKRFYSCFDPFRMLAYSSKLGKINPAGREGFLKFSCRILTSKDILVFLSLFQIFQMFFYFFYFIFKLQDIFFQSGQSFFFIHLLPVIMPFTFAGFFLTFAFAATTAATAATITAATAALMRMTMMRMTMMRMMSVSSMARMMVTLMGISMMRMSIMSG